MQEIATIVCLANSRRNTGRCIAGKTVPDALCSRWIRPVSGRSTAEISDEEGRCEDGFLPHLLDVVEIPMIGPRPNKFQTENRLIDGGQWIKRGRMERSQVGYFVEEPATLWTNGYSTYTGLNDRVPSWIANELRNSLTLIVPEDLVVHVVRDGNLKLRVRAEFAYRGTLYNLAITDPEVEKRFSTQTGGGFLMKDVYVCVSLGEEYSDGFCYKLVAGII